jgi:hypothetical protein
MGPYSKRECSKEHHCVYENVCIQEDKMFYYPSPEESNLDFSKFGWEPYRDGGTILYLSDCIEIDHQHFK